MTASFVMQATHIPPTSFLDDGPVAGLVLLPLETKIFTAEHLDITDLCALRQVCHGVKTSCDFVLGKQLGDRIAHLNFCVKPVDLKILIGILHNESFRQHVRTITLSAATLQMPEPGYDRPVIGDAEKYLKDRLDKRAWTGRQDKDAIDSVVKILEMADTMARLQGIRIGSSLDVRWLESKIDPMYYDLTTLPYSLRSEIRQIRTKAQAEVRSFKEDDINQCITDRRDMNSFLMIVFSALHIAEYSKRNIDVFIRFECLKMNWQRRLSAMRNATRDNILETILEMSSWSEHRNYVYLQLSRWSEYVMKVFKPQPQPSMLEARISQVVRSVHFQDFAPDEDEVIEGIASISKVYQLLNRAVCDKDIHVYMTDTPRPCMCKDMNVPIPIIRHLHLKTMHLVCSSMISRFIEQQKSLISVEMTDVLMGGDSSCEQVFKTMLSMSLSTVIFKNLTTTREPLSASKSMPDRFKESVQVCGRAEVDSFLLNCTLDLGFRYKHSAYGGLVIIGFPTADAAS